MEPKLTCSLIAQVEEYLKEANRGNDDGAIILDDPDISLGDFSFAADNISQDANTASTASDPNMPFEMPNLAGQENSTFMNSQLMGLGISETLPPFEVIEELYAGSYYLSHGNGILMVLGTMFTFSLTIIFSPLFTLAAITSRSMDRQRGNHQCVCNTAFGHIPPAGIPSMISTPKLSIKELGSTWKRMR
jgi:hypothetical protein